MKYLVDANILSEARQIETGVKWAELLARLRTAGKAMPIKDSLIAATALGGMNLSDAKRLKELETEKHPTQEAPGGVAQQRIAPHL